MKIVCDYTLLNFNEVKELHLDEFLQIQRDAFIFNMEKTENGREYLKNAKRLETTDADYEELEKMLKGDEFNGY